MGGVEYYNSTHLNVQRQFRKYWLGNVDNLPAALVAMNHFDVYSSTKLERLRLGSGINRCSHIRYRCDAPPYNLTVEKNWHCPFLFKISRLTLQRLPIQSMLLPTCWWRSIYVLVGDFFFFCRPKMRLTYCPGHKEACEGRNNNGVCWIENQVRYWAHSTGTS